MIDITTALALILSGFLLVWLSQKAKLEFGDIPKTAIILSPFLLYLIITGKVAEFETLGLKAKLREAVKENVVSAARASDLMISSPEASKPNFYIDALWQTCRPYYVLTDKTAIAATGDLDRDATINIAMAIRSSIICGRFIALVVVDSDGKPVGFFLPQQFLEILRIPLVAYNTQPLISASQAYTQIVTSELGVILKNPVIRAQSEEAQHVKISADASVEAAYKLMLEKGTTVAAITDRFGRFDGIVTRSAVEARIIEKLLTASK
jgi:CBS domain-containing protein